MLKIMRMPALIVTALVGMMAVSGSSATVRHSKGEVLTLELGTVPVEHFAAAVRRHIKPLAHISPDSLAAQRFAAAFHFGDS